MDTRVRPYSGEQDLPAIFDLLVAAKDAGTVDLELRSTSLRVVLRDTAFDTERFTLLIEREDRLVAFGILWRGRCA